MPADRTGDFEGSFVKLGENAQATDDQRLDPGFGRGGVPWILLLFYVAFLVFFTWYALEYQLPDFIENATAAEATAPAAAE